jgi:hypothetical protein
LRGQIARGLLIAQSRELEPELELGSKERTKGERVSGWRDLEEPLLHPCRGAGQRCKLQGPSIVVAGSYPYRTDVQHRSFPMRPSRVRQSAGKLEA